MQRSVRAAFIAGMIFAGVVASPVVAAPPKGGVGDAVQSVNSDYVAFVAFARSVAASADLPVGRLSAEALADHIRQLVDTELSFNMAYLALLDSMQDENARFTALSEIMKTKHDTVQNSISNVR